MEKIITAKEARELSEVGKDNTLEPLLKLIDESVRKNCAIGRRCIVIENAFADMHYLKEDCVELLKDLGYQVLLLDNSSKLRLDW